MMMVLYTVEKILPHVYVAPALDSWLHLSMETKDTSAHEKGTVQIAIYNYIGMKNSMNLHVQIR